MCLVPKPGTSKKGNMQKLFSQTRFSYGDLMIQQYLANKYFLERMFVGATRYNAITSKISSSQVSMFKDIVVPGIGANRHLDVKAELIHRLTRLVCKLIHHVEQKKCKASWVNALFFALMKDFEEWSDDREVERFFDVDTISAVHDVLINRWHGSKTHANGRVVTLVAFKQPVWTAAAMFDPYYTPTNEEYNKTVDDEVLDYVQSVSDLIKPYQDQGNSDAQLLVMESELNNMVMRRGKWGDLIEMFQRSLPVSRLGLTSHIKKEIFRQNHMRPV